MNETKEAVRERLQLLTDQAGGRLTPQAVVEDATDPDSPLHGFFEWDDRKAAQSHRIEQARTLIRSVEVVIRTDVTVLRAPYFVRDPSASESESGYVSTASLRGEKDIAREVVLEEFSRVAHVLRRARNVARALDVADDVDRLLDGVMELRQRVEAVTV